MTYYFAKTPAVDFDEAVRRTTEALRRDSFGIITAIDVTQTCTARVKPKAQVDIQAVVANTGDVQLTIAPNLTGIGADAGTPLDESDDFSPAYASGDVNTNQILDPGEQEQQAFGEFTQVAPAAAARWVVGGGARTFAAGLGGGLYR